MVKMEGIMQKENENENEKCLNCGSSIEKDYILFINGAEYSFDSFECAVNFVAPRCSHCQSVIFGTGLKDAGVMFCNTTCSEKGQIVSMVP
jgi:hypothetical protein